MIDSFPICLHLASKGRGNNAANFLYVGARTPEINENAVSLTALMSQPPYLAVMYERQSALCPPSLIPKYDTSFRVIGVNEQGKFTGAMVAGRTVSQW